MSFLRHEPCENCGSKDNKAVYADGHTFCFGCKKHTRPTETTYIPEEPKTVPQIQPYLVSYLPKENKDWLRQYLTDDQIDQYFWYYPAHDRHVYLDYDKDDKLVFWEGRKVGNLDGIKKTICYGQRTFKVFGKWKETHTICIVEDIVSAIKISDLVGVVCLHGSAIPNSLYTRIGYMSTISHVIIWMDRDKLSDAEKYVRKFSNYGIKCSLVMTPQDPKVYSLDEIKEILKDSV